MSRMGRVVFGAVLAVVGLQGLPAYAGQTDSFGTTPDPARVAGEVRRSFFIPLERAGTFRDEVRVYNRTGKPLQLAVYAADAASDRDGVISIGYRGAPTTGLANSISLSRDSVELPPHGAITIPFQVHVRPPAPADPLAAIVVENASQGSGSGLDLVQRVAILVRPAIPGSPIAAVRVPDPEGSWLWIAGAAALIILLAAVARRRLRRRIPAEVIQQ